MDIVPFRRKTFLMGLDKLERVSRKGKEGETRVEWRFVGKGEPLEGSFLFMRLLS